MTNNQLTENSVTQLLNSVKLARDNAERDDNRVDHSFYHALARALEELQERRKADSEPVAWDYEWASCITCEGPQDFKRIIEREAPPEWAIEEGQARNIIPLYRHAQPALADKNPLLEFAREYIESWELGMPGDSSLLASARKAIADSEIPQPALVVPDRSIFEKWWESQNGAPLDGWDSLRATDGYCDDGIDGQFEAWNACRAAMLNHPSSVQPNTDATPGAEIKHPSSNSPVIPGEWIPVSERMPESNKFVLVSNGVWVGQGLYDDSEHLESDGHWQDEHREFINVLHHPVTHWMPLPAGPQEVQGE